MGVIVGEVLKVVLKPGCTGYSWTCRDNGWAGHQRVAVITMQMADINQLNGTPTIIRRRIWCLATALTLSVAVTSAARAVFRKDATAIHLRECGAHGCPKASKFHKTFPKPLPYP